MMRKIFFLIIVLGMVLGFTGCSAMCYQPVVAPSGGVYNYNYQSRNFTRNGTRISGKPGKPIGLYWANMSIIRRGALVTVLDSDGRVMAQYDMRYRQQVNDSFSCTSLTGMELQVSLYIRGAGGVNYITVRGYEKEHYSLSY